MTHHQAAIICGKRIGERIRRTDYKRSEVAEAINMPKRKLDRCIDGLTSPNLREIRALATFLRCTADHLLGLDK